MATKEPSAKQIAWAEKIKTQALLDFAELCERPAHMWPSNRCDEVKKFLNNQTDPMWWIKTANIGIFEIWKVVELIIDEKEPYTLTFFDGRWMQERIFSDSGPANAWVRKYSKPGWSTC